MISPKDVQRAAKRLERENMRFRTFLKGHVDPDDLDEKFHELHRELFEGYDCSQCGNCCRTYSTSLENSEISSIAAYLNMSEPDFTKRYLSNGSERILHQASMSIPYLKRQMRHSGMQAGGMPWLSIYR